ncbi:MAG TPA: hypothetical protein VKU39_11050 [Streptosporangiaceae bacterium]|nr:hypothetical protein [Streptosporangiaceae bacterium]
MVEQRSEETEQDEEHEHADPADGEAVAGELPQSQPPAALDRTYLTAVGR